MPKENNEVGAKRKTSDGGTGTSKKRVVETSPATTSEKIEDNNSTSSIEIKPSTMSDITLSDDYVLITMDRERPNTRKPKVRTGAKSLKLQPATRHSVPLKNKASILTCESLPFESPLPIAVISASKTHDSAASASPLVVTSDDPPPEPKEEDTKDDGAEVGMKKSPESYQGEQRSISGGWLPKIQLFWIAALSGQSKVVHFMVTMGADVEETNDRGESLLLEACRLGHERAVQVFLECGSSTESLNKDGETAISVALRLGYLTLADILVDYKANIEAKDRNGDPLLVQSVRQGNYLNALYLIGAGVNVEAKSKSGESPLALAFFTNQLDIARLLLNSGAEVDKAIRGGETLLSRAVFLDNRAQVELLLAAGADVETLGSDGVTKPLLRATSNGNEDIVRMLLDRHAHTEARNKNHWTPLLVSAEHGRLKILRMLLNAGANIDTVTKDDGKTSLMWAIVKGHDMVAMSLLEAGANVDIRSKAGNKALAVAQQYGRRKVAELLRRGKNETGIL